jgi:hypothetical protein
MGMNAESRALTSQVHDLWFSLNEVTRCGSSAALRVRLFGDARTQPTGTLVIENVDRIEVVDTERVDWYDINRVEIADDGRACRVHGNIPVLLIVSGSTRLVVRVEWRGDQR